MDLRVPSALHEVGDARLAARGVRLLLKRDDLIHSDFPGGKWRKLKYNLEAAAGRPILTFGGAYSNHLLATAAAGWHLGFPTIGMVRGEQRPSPVLAQAREFGMTLRHISRGEYRRRAEDGFTDPFRTEFGDVLVIPEGGANAYGMRGCAEILAEIDADFDVVCCATGTGTTLAGLATALRPGQQAVGFAALKGGAFLRDDVARLIGNRPAGRWRIETDFHFGGYARSTPALDAFIDDFRDRHGITLDRVYEAKMMAGLFHTAPPDSTVVALLA